MSLNKRIVLFILNDIGLYRILLLVLLVSSPALYLICHHNTYDPAYLRLLNGLLCLITLSLSFFKKRLYYTLSLYVTLASYLVVNSGILLAQNNFINIYIFDAIIIFTEAAVICKKKWGFVALTLLNTLLIAVAYKLAPSPIITPGSAVAIVLACVIIAYGTFLARLVYGLKVKKALDNLSNLNKSLLLNEHKLRDSRNQLHALINSANDIVFEVDAEKRILNVWHSNSGLYLEKDQLIDNTLLTLAGEKQAFRFLTKLDNVIKTCKADSIDFPSLIDGKWFKARMAPVYDREGSYTSRFSISITDITESKQHEQDLQLQKELLLEAQDIAHLANWWFDGATRESYWSDNLFNILETYEIPEGVSKYTYYISLVHPDDKEKTVFFFENIVKSHQTTLEHKIITPDDNIKYLKVVRGSVTLKPDNTLDRISGVIQDITEIRMSAKLAKMSQVELIEAQTIAKIGNWKFELNNRTLSWSAEIAKIYAIRSKGASFKRFVHRFIASAHPDDRNLLFQIIRDPASAIDKVYEYRLLGTNGEVKHLSLIVGKTFFRNGEIRKIIGTLQDITERKTAEIHLKQSETKYRHVLEGVRLAAITVNGNGSITFCNSYLAELLGYEREKLIGLNWIDNFAAERLRDFLRTGLSERHQNTQLVYPVICKNGEERIISWQNTIIHDENGQVIEITGIGEDVTDQQKATQELISAKEDAERSSRFKSEFLSTMSHEIRTPMNAVIGTTNLLLAEDPKPEQLEYLNTLKFSGENLLAIINDILDYNKIEAGKFELHKQPVNLMQLINKIWHSFIHKASQQGIDLKIIADTHIPDYLQADPVRISQILNNLIGNSIKFTRQGHVIIKVTAGLPTADGQIAIRFSVADTGIGISPDKIHVIFDPFEQDMAVPGTKHVSAGTGLGLAITKRLIELHNSQIEVASTLGKGTTFTFDIVFEIANAPGTEQKVNVNLTSPSLDLGGIRILVVDDNKMNLLIATKFLKRWHAQVDEANSGAAAVELTLQHNYDLIIMDLQMPGMDGFEATRIIRGKHADVPIIALTADAMPDTFNKALAAGMNDYLTKPFMPDALFEKVSKHRPSPIPKATE